MNKHLLIERLRSLGFKEYESRVLVVLLKGVPMSASEIAKESGIIRNSIYDILKSFVDKGYCNEIETNTILNYQIVEPAFILDKLEKEYKSSYNSRLSNLHETFGYLQSLYLKESENIDTVERNIQLIRGFNKHRVAKYIELVNNSKKEILGMYSHRRVVVDQLSKDAAKFIKNGGIIRSIYQLSGDESQDRELIKVCKFFEEGGEMIRIADFKLPNITVFDNIYVFINLSSDKNVPRIKQADLIIHNSDFAGHIRDLFDYYWDKSKSLSDLK